MAYRSAPPDPSKPVYHGSAFPWDVVETAGAIHVGTHDQAMDLAPKKPNLGIVQDALGGNKPVVTDFSKNQNGGGPAVTLRKGGSGGGTQAEAANWDPNAPSTRTRAFRAPPSAPNGGITELSFNPGVGFHDVDVSDRVANTAHLAHSREAGYPRGGSIDESAHDWTEATLQKNINTPPTPDTPRAAADAYGAMQALRENKVLRYANTMEGDGQGVSYVVPNPDLNLRQYGEDPKPVAGKEYHQTPLPGIDLAAVKNPGPFHDEFHDGGPDHFGLGDVRKPNLSRTRRRNQTATATDRPREFKDEPLF